MKERKFKWVVELEVDESWVADGFDLDDERAHAMLCREIPYAYSWELKAKVLKTPSREAILRKQGYSEDSIKASL